MQSSNSSLFGTDKDALRQSVLAFAVFTVLLFVLFGQYLIGPPNIHSARVLVMLSELSLIVFWIVSAPKAIIVRALPRIRWALMLWFLVGALGIPFAAFNWASAFVGQLEWFAHFLTLVVLCDFIAKNKVVSLNGVMIGVIMASLFSLAFFSYRWLQLDAPRDHNWVWDAQPFLNIRHVGFLVMPGYLAALHYAMRSNLGVRTLGFIASTLLLAMLFWAGGRASIGAAAFGALLMLLQRLQFERHRFFQYFCVVIAGVLMAVFLSQVFSVNNASMGLSFNHGKEGADTLDGLSSGRVSVWLSVFSDMTLVQWLIGHGVDNYRYLPGRSDITVQPHSLFVQMLSYWGVIVATIIVVGAWYFAIRMCFKSWCDISGRRQASATFFTGGVILISYLVLALVDGNFYHSWAVLLILPFFSIALVFLLEGRLDECHKKDKRLSSSWLYGVALLVVITAIQLVNVSTVFGGRTPLPDSWRASLVMAIPYNTLWTEHWLAPWQQQSQDDMIRLLRWLQINANDRYRFMLMEADMLSGAGYDEAAENMYLKALNLAPMQAKKALIDAGPPNQ